MGTLSNSIWRLITGERYYQPEINKKIIGIDFGSSGLCYAYGYLDEQKGKHCFIGHFENQGRAQKILNEIILDHQLSKVLAFGNDCISFLKSEHDRNLIFHHFKNIKMNLYNKVYKIKAVNSGKETDLEYIIKLILIQTKKKAIEQLRIQNPNLEENIRCIVTIPAIWDYKSKDIMLKASIASGLITQEDDFSHFFALEPEAASLYFSHENEDKIYRLKLIDEREKSFFLCDFGSGTVDIVTHKTFIGEERTSFRELYPPVGNFLGSNKINEYFIDRVIKPLIGEENLNKIKKELYEPENYGDWINFEKSIEEFKINFQRIEQINDFYEINCELFEALEIDISEKIDNFNENNKWKLSLSIKKRNKNKKSNNYKINFPNQIIYDFTFEIVNKAIDLIVPIIDYMRANEKDIKTLILCGGASLSNIIYNIFSEHPSLKYIHVIRGKNPECSIAEGSVLFALDPFAIVQRKAKYALGVKCSQKLGGLEHHNVFSKIINKGDNVYSDQEMENIYYMNSSKATIELYRTENNEVKFCDERDERGELKIHKFGEYIIDVGEDFDKNNRKILIRIKLGGTFVTSSAIYCKTNKQNKVVYLLNFLD